MWYSESGQGYSKLLQSSLVMWFLEWCFWVGVRDIEYYKAKDEDFGVGHSDVRLWKNFEYDLGFPFPLGLPHALINSLAVILSWLGP